jgi:hypothetical protein
MPPLDAGQEGFIRCMNGWRTLEAAIPRADSDRIAYLLSLHANTVRTWRREPETDDDANTGRRSPLDRVCDLITAVFLSNPQGAELIVEHVRAHLESLKESQGPRPLEPHEIERKAQEAHLLITQVLDQLRAVKKEKLQMVK